LPVSGISAQEATETPTATETVEVTSTATYSSIYDLPGYDDETYYCPGHQPIGWGTVTPEPVWLMNCSHCVTPEQDAGYFPTFEWGDNPMVTPGPTSTSGPTPTEVYKMTIEEFGYLVPCVELPDVVEPEEWYWCDYDFSRFDEFYKFGLDPILLEHDLVWTSSFEYKMTAYYPGGTSYPYNGELGLRFSNGNTSSDDGTLRITFKDGSIAGEYGGDYIDLSGQVFETTEEMYTFWFILYTGEGEESVDLYADLVFDIEYVGSYETSAFEEFYFGFYHDGFYTDFVGNVDQGIMWWPDGVDVHGGYSADYCKEVNDLGGSYDPGDPGTGVGIDDEFSIFPIYIGEEDCFVVGGWEVPLSSWFSQWFPDIEDWTLPGFKVCFIPLEFGNMMLFDLEIDMNFMSYAIAGIVLMRFVLKR